MNDNQDFSLAEISVMHNTFDASMLRAADIIDRITENDVVDFQEALLASGSTLEQVAKIDRAMVAAAHLRACVKASREKRKKTG